MPGHERRHPGRGGFRGDHAERLREDRRHRHDVREREQMHEMAMLERPGEKHPLRSGVLQLGAVVAEADDHRARIELAHRVEQQVHALVEEQLPEVKDGRLVRREERREALGVAVVRQAFVRVAGVRRVGPRLHQQPPEGLPALLRPELIDVNAGRNLVHAVDVADDVFEDGTDVRGTDEHRFRVCEGLRPPRRQLVVAAHRVLELRAVCLDHEGCAAGETDRSAEQDVICEHEICGQPCAERGGVPLDVAFTLLGPEVLQQPRLETLIAVEHEHRQEAADVRPHDLCAADVIHVRVSLLAEDDHVVSRAAPFPRERARVDIRPGPAEQVTVPEQDAHRRQSSRRGTVAPSG